ncbi:MAG TPA: hypothetical protein VFH56_01555, partial [Acidimicrobiales bacterium]|nr:hypothetical protein [Acidimicrobiales bacterium]
FKADTSDAPVAASPTTPGAPEGGPAADAAAVAPVPADERPSGLHVAGPWPLSQVAELRADLGDAERVVSDAEHGNVLDLVRDIHRMVSDMHSLVNEVKPVFDQFTTELRTKGVGGLFSAMLGGGLGGGRR